MKNLLSHSTEKLRRGTPQSFTKLLVAKNFMDRMGMGRRREGVTRFSVWNFCLTGKKIVGGTL